jgi:Tol biopolymer transport system component
MILGTLEYMAPEQVEGKEVDSRTDIFACGVVVYEMATGRKAFKGDSKASLTAAILTFEPPPITKIQPLTPPSLERVVKRCLAKDPEDRWQTARDLTLELKWIAEGGGEMPMAAGAQTVPPRFIATGRWWERLAWILFLLAAIVSSVTYVRRPRAPVDAIIAKILPPEKAQFNLFGAGPPVLSPDGSTVAFSALDASGKSMLWAHSLDSLTARPLARTERGNRPFWSADSRALGFFADGKLKTLYVSSGHETDVTAEIDGLWAGGSWSRQGTLLFIPNMMKGLDQVAASGGTPASVLKVDSSKYNHYLSPKFLPDGKHFLYHANALNNAFGGVYFASLDGKENRLLLKGAGNAIYGSGFLLYLRGTTLMAQAFDPEQGQLKGDALPIAEHVAADAHAAGFFDASENGVLIYQAGTSLGEIRLYWFDRAGNKLGENEALGDWILRLSPDGARLALIMGGIQHNDLWVDELARGVRMRLTKDPESGKGSPVWSPDGNRILFAESGGTARRGIYQMNSNGAGGKELLLPAENSNQYVWPTSWSQDGRFILFVRGNPSGQDIWVLPLTGDRKPRLFVQSAFDGQFSPDGRWVAYASGETGKDEVYVVPFDATEILNSALGAVSSPGGKSLISSGEGRSARWRKDGSEIFYLGPDNQMMAVEVEERGDRFEARKAQALFRAQVVDLFTYDVTPDGKRFVLSAQKAINPNEPLTLVVNWTALLAKNP